MKRIGYIALKVAVSGACLYWLVRVAGLQSLFQQAKEVSLLFLFACWLVGILMMSLSALRWWRINQYLRLDLPKAFCLLAFFESVTVSLLLPGSTGGDVVRAVRAGRLSGRYRKAIVGTVFDRASALFAILIFAAMLAPLVLVKEYSLELAVAVCLAIAAVVAAAAALAIIPRWRAARRRRWSRELLKFALMFRRTFLSWRRMTEVLLLSILIQAGIGIMLCAALVASNVETLWIPGIMAAAAFGILAATVPLTLAGIGVREGTIAWFLSGLGYPQTEAVLGAFVFGVAIILQGLPGIVVWLWGGLNRFGLRQG